VRDGRGSAPAGERTRSASAMGAEAAGSGNRWSARVEGRPRSLRQARLMLDRLIDRRLGQGQRQGRRRGVEGMSNGARGHADRTQQIGRVTVVMTRGLPVVRRGNGGYLRGKAMLEALAVDGMNVAKGQAEIDGERKERQPRTPPDMVTKPAHYGPSQFFVRLRKLSHSSRLTEAVNRTGSLPHQSQIADSGAAGHNFVAGFAELSVDRSPYGPQSDAASHSRADRP
jgi:hypothetical protein